MTEINLRHMRYIVAMAEAGSISAAARTLRLAQPTLSGSLREAERALGVTLFLRARGKALVATAEGRKLLPEIRRLIDHADDVGRRAAGLTASTTGTVRIGSLVTIAPILVPPLLAAFRADVPDAVVTVTTGDQATLLALLATGDLHLALTYDLDLDDGVDFASIAKVPPKVLLPASHPLAGRRSIHLDALAGEPFILLDLPHSADYFQAVFLASDVSMRPAMRCGDLSLVRALVAEGLGYSVVNLVPAQRGIDGLSYVSLDGGVPPLRIGFAVADHGVPAATEAFRALAVTMLPKLLTTRANRR